MSDQYCCQSGETLVFTCAGAAYSGQVANHAGLSLMTGGKANLFCIAALAAEIPDKLDRARKASKRIAIDGCEDHCCSKIMQSLGVPLDQHVVVTDMGIEKQPEKMQMVVHAKRVVENIKENLLRST
ncbi:MAG: putative zinc-binding protein [Planctomycetota bacterium]|nr:MAG: putative zinc-binding protein [Planctomycetota bacterium]